MRHILATTFIAAILCLCSCVKKELPAPAPPPPPPHVPGGITDATVNMNSNYKWQVFYDLKTNAVISTNLKTSWDVGFEASTAGYHMILNTSKSMMIMNTTKTDFSSVSLADTAGFSAKKMWENPAGSMDSTAAGDWRTNKPVYIVDRGYDENGTALGLEKIQLLSVNDNSYSVMVGKLTASTGTVITITKDSTYNFTFLSFDNGGQTVTVEPPKANWTIMFSQYTHTFYDPLMPYLVTGCLLNHYNTTAYKDTTTAFAQIVYSTVNAFLLVPAINTIGYDWKTYTGTTYTTNTQDIYLIKDNSGTYYKLHFLDFYNKGVKGNPTWEYQQL